MSEGRVEVRGVRGSDTPLTGVRGSVLGVRDQRLITHYASLITSHAEVGRRAPFLTVGPRTKPGAGS
jgi:hypothetical protein